MAYTIRLLETKDKFSYLCSIRNKKTNKIYHNITTAFKEQEKNSLFDNNDKFICKKEDAVVVKFFLFDSGKKKCVISPDAYTFITDGMKIKNEDIELYYSIKVDYSTSARGSSSKINLGIKQKFTKEVIQDQLDYWIEEPRNYGIQSAKTVGRPFLNFAKIKCNNCKYFH